MGIQGLLPLLKDIHKQVNLSQLEAAGLSRVGVDAYVWLYRGAFGCATELFMGQAAHARQKYVGYCMRRVELLRRHNLVPFLVFDGGNLPQKAGTDSSRKETRESNLARGRNFHRLSQLDKAEECFQRSLEVTPEMAYELIKELRRANVEFVVSPYEADAQLAFLIKNGHIDAVMTEDSDLLVFGCQQVLYKLDWDGSASHISISDLGRLSCFTNWTPARFRQLCILSGCDYLPSPEGIGLRTALKVLKTHGSIDRVLRYWKWGKAVGAPTVPPDYADRFRRAELTFAHQRVWDPKAKKLCPIEPYPPGLGLEEVDWLGPIIPNCIAEAIAKGFVNPITLEAFEEENYHLLLSASVEEAEQYKPHAETLAKIDSNKPSKEVPPATEPLDVVPASSSQRDQPGKENLDPHIVSTVPLSPKAPPTNVALKASPLAIPLKASPMIPNTPAKSGKQNTPQSLKLQRGIFKPFSTPMPGTQIITTPTVSRYFQSLGSLKQQAGGTNGTSEGTPSKVQRGERTEKLVATGLAAGRTGSLDLKRAFSFSCGDDASSSVMKRSRSGL
ncbi:PIN domain-like protein [Cladochytrium replicatum]|nr:PIN domain-like protein [Cladochytrium replicatum]